MSLASKELIRDRAEMLCKARDFFWEKGVMEVDCPALGPCPSIDLHIDVMRVEGLGYLHTSPEYGMKKLLAAGMGDIYQIGHVFRREEIGPLHNPEFTMAEWYRCGFSFDQMIEETIEFIRLFLGELPEVRLSYRQAFRTYLNCEYRDLSVRELLELAAVHHITLAEDANTWDKDTLLQLLVSFVIEPHLGKEDLLVLYNFPASQSALAQTIELPCGESVAFRFEVYHKGIELANGYHELADAEEQRRRFDATNRARAQMGKETLAIDEEFLNALRKGLPDCCGVAVGFDRLTMLRHKRSNIAPILV